MPHRPWTDPIYGEPGGTYKYGSATYGYRKSAVYGTGQYGVSHYGKLDIARLNRYNPLQGVEKALSHRYTAAIELEKPLLHRYTDYSVDKPLLHRYRADVTVEKSLQHRYSILSQQYNPTWSGSGGGASQAVSYTIRAFNQGSIQTIGSYAAEVTITLRENAAASWRLVVDDPEGLLHPERAGGQWQGWLTDDPYVSGYTGYARKFLFSCSYAGAAFDFVGIPTSSDYELNDSRQAFSNFVWSGTDVSHILSVRRDQDMSTVDSATSLKRRSDVITEICNQYNVQCDLSGLDTDPVVSLMHRSKGQPLSWIIGLLEMMWDVWTVRGETLYCYTPQQKAKENADWTMELDVNLIRAVSVSASFSDAVSRVVMKRTRPANTTVKTVDLNNFGQYNVSFDQDVYSLNWRMTTTSGEGIADTFLLRNSSGVIIGIFNDRAKVYGDKACGGANGLCGRGPVRSVTFTWGAATPDVQGTGAIGQIEFYGVVKSTQEGIDIGGVYEVDVSSSVYAGDPNAYPKVFPVNPLFASGSDLTQSAQRFLNRVGRRRRTRRYVLHRLHILLSPGDTVREKIDSIGVDRAVYVTEVTHHFSPDPARRYTEFEAVEYV